MWNRNPFLSPFVVVFSSEIRTFRASSVEERRCPATKIVKTIGLITFAFPFAHT
jgi:hypothetical protein